MSNNTNNEKKLSEQATERKKLTRAEILRLQAFKNVKERIEKDMKEGQ